MLELMRAMCSEGCGMVGNRISKEPTLYDYMRTRYEVDENGCWIWRGRADRYGGVWYKNATGCAHVFSYQLHHGDIPQGKIVRHNCDVRGCINPEHLCLGTKKDNRRDFMERHPLAKELMHEAQVRMNKGRDNFWSNLSGAERAAWIRQRQEKQRAAYTPEKSAKRGAIMRRIWAERRAAREKRTS